MMTHQPRFKKNLGSNSKATKVSNIHKNYPYQLIAPIAPILVSQGPKPRSFMSCICLSAKCLTN